MTAANTPTGTSKPRLRFWIGAAALLILAAAGAFALVYPRLSANQPQKQLSLAQALTIVAQATQTAHAANPGAVEARPTRRATTAASSSSASGPLSTRQLAKAPNLPPAETSSGGPTIVFPATSSPNLQNPPADEPTFPVSNVTVRPTYTPKPTHTRTRTFTPAPTRTLTGTPGPGLPGLAISDITGALTADKGFSCKQEGSDPLFILWMCDYQSGSDLWYHVDIYGTPDHPVANLLVSVFQTNPNDALALDILQYLAALPYTGAKPDAARQWVAQTLPAIHSVTDVREKYFGAVRYHLFGGPQGRYLEMGVSSQ